MAFELAPLPYTYDALAPTIDELTMRTHHRAHHGAYVNALNAALAGTGWEDRPIEATLAELDRLPVDRREAVRDHGGGHANHALFWETMSPDGGREPTGDLGDAIRARFGSVRDMKRELAATAVGRFGSGWAWLVHDRSGLAVISTPNQDSPLMSGATPLLGVDVWEHAYYLKFQHRRADYLEAWWNVVDWEVVAARHAVAHVSST
jgi:Fe-Mn family superoxide dismutase